jgi:hypothetical protein
MGSSCERGRLRARGGLACAVGGVLEFDVSLAERENGDRLEAAGERNVAL